LRPIQEIATALSRLAMTVQRLRPIPEIAMALPRLAMTGQRLRPIPEIATALSRLAMTVQQLRPIPGIAAALSRLAMTTTASSACRRTAALLWAESGAALYPGIRGLQIIDKAGTASRSVSGRK
jgi:hypothetical protein